MAQWSKTINPADYEFKIETAKDDLDDFMISLKAKIAANGGDGDGDIRMGDGQGDHIEQINVPPSTEDELSDIPAEMREMVAAEIASFRDRSTRRDMERLRREEEQEAAERNRSRPNRLATPPLGGTNGIPIGPRDRTVQGAPSGPKGYRGAQMPKDYADGVSFVNGIKDEYEYDSASDGEVEMRRHARRDDELEQMYLEQERHWLAKEKAHFSAVERQKKEEESAIALKDANRQALATRLANFDDEAEMRKPTHLYYKDRKSWHRERRMIRGDERRRDDKDRREEDREMAAVQRRADAAKDMADDFLAQQAEEMSARHAINSSRREPGRAGFSLNFGASAGNGGRDVKVDDLGKQDLKRSGNLDIELLLDDNEGDPAGPGAERKPLRPMAPAADGEKLTDEERAEAIRELAAVIQTWDKETLFEWPIKWDSLSEDVIENHVKPRANSLIYQALNMEEDMLVELIVDVVRERGSAEEMVSTLEDALDTESEDMVKSIWKLLVFHTEKKARGLLADGE